MKILRECTAILTSLGLGMDKSVEIIGLKIPRPVIQYSIIISLSVCVLSAIQFCRQNITESTKILLPAAAVFTFFLQVVIYISLLMKKRHIVELVEFLGRVVSRRKCRLIEDSSSCLTIEDSSSHFNDTARSSLDHFLTFSPNYQNSSIP